MPSITPASASTPSPFPMEMSDAPTREVESLKKAILAHLAESGTGEMAPQELRENVDALSNRELSKLLQEMASHAITEEKPELHALMLQLVPLARMETLANEFSSDRETEKGEEERSAIATLASDVANYYLDLPDGEAKGSFLLEVKRSLSVVIDFFPNMINTFLIAFKLYDVGKDPQTAYEASAMLDIYYKFFMIPAAIVVAVNLLFPALGLPVYAVAAAVVLLAIVAIVVYVKWLQPAPNNLPHCNNLTQDAALGYQSPVVGRESLLETLVKDLGAPKSERSYYPLLIGEPGVGKSTLIKGLAEKIVSADNQLPESLKGRKIFEVNTASLLQGGMFGFAEQWKVLFSRLMGHEDEVILFFDEFHVIAADEALVNHLQMELSRGKMLFVAATTREQYEKSIKPIEALNSRFKTTTVGNMEPADLKEVLLAKVREAKSTIPIKENLLDELIKKSNEVIEKIGDDQEQKYHQPRFALQLLSDAMSRVRIALDEGYTPASLQEMKARFKSLQLTISLDNSCRLTTEKGKQKLKELKKLQGEIKKAEKRVAKKRRAIKIIKVMQKELDSYKSQQKREATEALESNEKNTLSHFFYNYHYLVPELEKVLEKCIEEVDDDEFSISIDSALIDKVIKEKISGRA